MQQSENLDIHLIQFSPEWGKISLTLERLEKLICSSFQSKHTGYEVRGMRCEENDMAKQSRTPNSTTSNQLVVLPEMFSTGFRFSKEVSEPMNGKTLQWMQNIAKSLNTAIYGSLLISENDKLYNRGFFVYPNGEYKYYDKRHCFVMSDEPKYITPGKEIVTVDYEGWRLRLNICHDMRFPVWSRNTYKNGQYNYEPPPMMPH